MRLELLQLQGFCLFLHFNSIKVRLELELRSIINALSKFQFHKGAIRTVASSTPLRADESFQFHKGAIRTLACGCGQDIMRHFNSIKVRLERS